VHGANVFVGANSFARFLCKKNQKRADKSAPALNHRQAFHGIGMAFYQANQGCGLGVGAGASFVFPCLNDYALSLATTL
jgi:hypothetical protein